MGSINASLSSSHTLASSAPEPETETGETEGMDVGNSIGTDIYQMIIAFW